MAKKVIVLGGGLSGLAVGINARLKGLDCTIIEKNNDVGGCLGAYTRKGFLIDHCIHWLIGTNKDNNLFKEWTKLHAFDENTRFTHFDDLVSIEYQGNIYRLSKDYKKSQRELIALSNEDADLINEFFNHVEGAIKIYYEVNAKFLFRNFTHFPAIFKTSNIDRIDFANKFKSEGL